ncbi:universal stress protein [soil metagenome]
MTACYKRILVPIDCAVPSAFAFEHALSLAWATTAELRVLHLLDDASFKLSESSSSMHWSIESSPDGLAAVASARHGARLIDVPFSSLIPHRATGDLPGIVAREALRWHADLIVVGTHARSGFERLVVGSDAETIVRRAPVPVLLVPCRSGASGAGGVRGDACVYSHILVPYDGSATSERGLDEAIRIAQGFKADLRIIHVVDDVSIAFAIDAYYADVADWQRSLIEAAGRLVGAAEAKARAAGVECVGCVVDTAAGAMGDIVIRYADQHAIDLIVMGTHGRRGLGRAVMGSGAESVSRLSKIPVMLVRLTLQSVPAGRADESEQVSCSLPSAALSIE